MDVIVETNYGKLSGVEKQGHFLFRGVPYAKAPLGNLRWKRPVKPDSWEGVRPAERFSAKCPQTAHEEGSFYHKEFGRDGDYLPEMSEDCLYLNIWTPTLDKNAKLPVAFWIHGGAFMGGYGSEIVIDGKSYCDRDVILVSINYRLGVFGFLAHPELSSENEDGISGNYGIYDQIAALEWVYDNIGNFGGDNKRINIFGQSAGAMSVQTLVSSRLTKKYVYGAILQSGGGYKSPLNSDRSLEEAERIGTEYNKVLGAANLDEMRKASVHDLLEGAGIYLARYKKSGFQSFPFIPCVDGVLMTHGYNETLEKGLQLDINYMLGSTSHDISYTQELAEQGKMTELHHSCVKWAQQQERLGRKKAYIYLFSHLPQGDGAGAFHSSELWYMFNSLDRSWRPKNESDYIVAETMLDFWCSFMKNGSPNTDKLPRWFPWSEETPFVREFI